MVALGLALLTVCVRAVEFDFSSEQEDDEYGRGHHLDHEDDYHVSQPRPLLHQEAGVVVVEKKGRPYISSQKYKGGGL